MKFLYLPAAKVRSACSTALAEQVRQIEANRNEAVEVETKRRLNSWWGRVSNRPVDSALVRKELFPWSAHQQVRWSRWGQRVDELIAVCDLAMEEYGEAYSVTVTYEDVNDFLGAYWGQ